jgi:hypothetical protein
VGTLNLLEGHAPGSSRIPIVALSTNRVYSDTPNELEGCAYQQLGASGTLVVTLGIQEILDVGPVCDYPSEVNRIRKRMGRAPAEELLAIFSQAKFDFVPHEWFAWQSRRTVIARWERP